MRGLVAFGRMIVSAAFGRDVSGSQPCSSLQDLVNPSKRPRYYECDDRMTQQHRMPPCRSASAKVLGAPGRNVARPNRENRLCSMSRKCLFATCAARHIEECSVLHYVLNSMSEVMQCY